MKKNEIFLKCGCGCNCNLLNVVKWEDEDQFNFLVYYGHRNYKISFWERVKILFRGYTLDTEIILKTKDIKDLINFLEKK